MSFRSSERLATKVDRARTLALATAILLNKGGERFGLTGDHLPPSRGNQQIEKMAQRLFDPDPADFGSPATGGMSPHSRALFVSDFLGDFSATQAALTKAADKGVQGVILQVLDPQEETFPFHGRTVFHSMTGGTQHETLKADALKSRYLDRLTARKDALQSLARTTGWQFQTHHTDQSAMTALLWLYQSLAGQR